MHSRPGGTGSRSRSRSRSSRGEREGPEQREVTTGAILGWVEAEAEVKSTRNKKERRREGRKEGRIFLISTLELSVWVWEECRARSVPSLPFPS